MDHNEFERNFTCPICQQFAQNAYQGECCGVVLCQACLNRCRSLNPNCPKCRKEQYKAHPSLRIRMIIENSLVDCRHQCGQKIRFKERQSHEQFCSATKQFFKNQLTLYKFLRNFILAWGSVSHSLLKSTDSQNTRKLQTVYQISIQTIIRSFSKHQKQKFSQETEHKYWDVLIHNEKQYEQLILNLITIFHRHRNYVQVVKHCLVIIQLPIHHNNTFYVYEVLANSVKGALMEQKGVEECYKQVYDYYGKLNAENEGQFCSYLICLNMLVQLAHANGKKGEEEEFAMKLSSAESRALKISYSQFETVCWYVHVLNHLKQPTQHQQQQGKSKEELKQQMAESTYLIQYYTKKILFTFQLLNQPNSFFTLLPETPNIFAKQIYKIEGSDLSPKFTEHVVINALVDIFSHTEIQPQKCFIHNMIQMGTEEPRLEFVYKLLCYELCHKKFNSFTEPHQFLVQKLRYCIEKLAIITIKKESVMTEDCEQVYKQGLEIFLNKFHQLKLPKQKTDKLETSITKLKQKLFNIMGQILGIIGQGNLNFRKEMLIRYQICRFFLKIQSYPPAVTMVRCMETAFYWVVFKQDKLLQSKQVQECIQMVTNATKNNFMKAFFTQFVNTCRNKIVTYKAVKGSKSMGNTGINAERDQIFKNQNIQAILNNFVVACEKLMVVPAPPDRKISKVIREGEGPEKKQQKAKQPKKDKSPKNKK